MSELTQEQRDQLLIEDGWQVESVREDGSRMWEHAESGHGSCDSHMLTSIGADPCVECGTHFEVMDRPHGKQTCHTCGYWLEQLANPKDAHVTDSWMHRREPGARPPGHGGYWVQGVIPERFRDRFAQVHTIQPEARVQGSDSGLRSLPKRKEAWF